MLKIGLTGSIGTGKSTVGKIFSELGAYVIDADKIVHTLLRREDIKEKIRKEFGDVFDSKGEIDRKKLGSIVFKDPEKKRKLESIIHPEVRKEIGKRIKEIEKKYPEGVVIVEVPLLIETGSYRDYDIVILVYAPEELQIERLRKKGFTEEEALRRIRSQLPIDEKVKYADIVIYNTEDLEKLEQNVKSVYEKLKERAEKR
ncbi:dephospho-CoA kinase [Persephonella sp.]